MHNFQNAEQHSVIYNRNLTNKDIGFYRQIKSFKEHITYETLHNSLLFKMVKSDIP